MRIISMAAAAGVAAIALAWASAPLAAPEVAVTVGPRLGEQATATYGQREVEQLAATLQGDVERALARTGAYSDSRIELILTDAKPNRPTAKQMADNPGLSFASFGVGGARIEGRAVAPDGSVRSLSYSWYETRINNAPYQSTWGDAEYAFDRFARELGKGVEVADR
jgi:hypothetical protein